MSVIVEGLSTILESCKKLHVLDLSGCRGIPTHWRRDAFTVFANGDLHDSDDSDDKPLALR